MFEDVSPAEVAAGLAETDCETLTDAQLVACMRDVAAVVAWAESLGLCAVAELNRRRHADHEAVLAELGERAREHGAVDGDEVDRFCAMEVATALRVSHRTAVERVRLARDVVTHLPATLRSMGAGVTGLGHVRAVRDVVASLEPPVARVVEADVLAQASSDTPAQAAARARRSAAAVDPSAAARRCAAARAARRATSWGLPDGVSVLQVTGPAETVAAAWARVDAMARASQDAARAALREIGGDQPLADGIDPRAGLDHDPVPSLDQLRADTVLRLLAGTHDLTEHQSPHVSVVLDVLVPVGTLLGATDGPAELSGHGPLPAEVARALAADATWRRVLLAPDGSVATPCGSRPHALTLYRPGETLARAIRARDVTCRFPGCRQPARRCDVDHTVPHPDGPTASCNLSCLCRMHHRAKHRAGWQLEQLAEGRLRWTSPTGRTCTTDPPRWRPPPRADDGRRAVPDRVRAADGQDGDGGDENDEPPWLHRVT